MQSTLSTVWIRVDDAISYKSDHYTTGTPAIVPKSMSTKVKIITRLMFEVAYHHVVVRQMNNNATETSAHAQI